MIKSFRALLFLALLSLPSACLSLKIAVHLPEEKGSSGNLELEYRFSESLQNISNYPAPRDDMAPLPLPLWEWDFRAIAAQSPTIQLLNYSFQPAKGADETGLVRAELSFASEDDLHLLLGPEIQWRGKQFSWRLSAVSVERRDASWPQLDGDLSSEETNLLEEFFAGQTLKCSVDGGDIIQRQVQELTLADFLTGKRNIEIQSAN